MNSRVINIIIGVLFWISGLITLLEGIFHMRASNLCIGISFLIVGFLYFMRKRNNKQMNFPIL